MSLAPRTNRNATAARPSSLIKMSASARIGQFEFAAINIWPAVSSTFPVCRIKRLINKIGLEAKVTLMVLAATNMANIAAQEAESNIRTSGVTAESNLASYIK